MKNLIVIFVFLNFFLTENILLLFRFSNFSIVNNLLIAISIVLGIVSNITLYRANKFYLICFLALLTLQIVFFVCTGSDNFKSTMSIGALFVLGAMPISRIKTVELWKRIFILFLSFYILECSLAIIERFFSVNLPIMRIGENLWEGISTGEDSSFRSEALLGHPLQNALIVLTSMSFILISKMSVNYKFSLWFLGFIALLCFNTRFAIAFSLLLLVLYIANMSQWHYTKREKKIVYISLLLVFLVGGGAFFLAGLGDRLMNMGLVDESSASARVFLFDLFIGLDINSFLFPVSPKFLESLMFYRNIKVIENFWVTYLFTYGLIFLAIIVICHFLILKNLYCNYSKFETIFTSFTFLVTASTNNSLVTSWHMLAYFLFFVLLFNPKFQSLILPAKMCGDRSILERKIIMHILKEKNTK